MGAVYEKEYYEIGESQEVVLGFNQAGSSLAGVNQGVALVACVQL